MPSRIPSFRPRSVGAKPRETDRRARERTADYTEAHRFYNAAPWRKLRASFLMANPLCADCAKLGLTVVAAHVHHKVERKADPSRALDWDNLEAVCLPCHNRKRRATIEADENKGKHE